MPETPEHKATLLPFPETTKEVLHLQRLTTVLPGIFILKMVAAYNKVKGYKQTCYG
jgi:hypothetical protein